MKTRYRKSLILFMAFLVLFQGCAPAMRAAAKSDQNRINTLYGSQYRFLEDRAYKSRLQQTLTKMEPGDAMARRLVSLYLHSLRRVAAGKVETEYEKKMAEQWGKIDKKIQSLLLNRVDYFSTLPIPLQYKLVDDLFIFHTLDKPITIAELLAETAGVVRGEMETTVCRYGAYSGKLAMPSGSEGLALSPTRPIACVAARETGLLLIDISDPVNPAYFSDPYSSYTSNITGYVNDVIAGPEGSFCMLITSVSTSSKQGGFECVDISNPMFPQQRGVIEGLYTKVAVSDDGGWAFSYNEKRATLDIIDISDLSAPRVITQIPDEGKVADLSFGQGRLVVLRQSGRSLFYQFTVDAVAGPQLIWWGNNVSPCGPSGADQYSEALVEGNYTTVARDGSIHVVAMTATGPVNACASNICGPQKHNSLTRGNNEALIVDNVTVGTDCQLPRLDFYRMSGSCPDSQISHILLVNEVKGIAVREQNVILPGPPPQMRELQRVYIADRVSTPNCKIKGEPVHFRTYIAPEAIGWSREISPTIDTINGMRVTGLNEMERMTTCGGIFCSSDAECLPKGICWGGICSEAPTIEVEDNQTIILTGINYWDTDALVMVKSINSLSDAREEDCPDGQGGILYDATVYGDETGIGMDRMIIQLDAAVTQTGLKKIKILNRNRDPKIYTCADCDNPGNPECAPDYVCSEEVIVYFQNGPVERIGYDLKAISLKAVHLTPGWGDDEIVMVSTAPGDIAGSIITPDEEGYSMSRGEKQTLPPVLLAFNNPEQANISTTPGVMLKEVDNTAGLGEALLLLGAGCAGANALLEICGGYCYLVCGGIALVGLILVLFDGYDWIAMERDNGLVLTKTLASQILQYGDQCMPDEWDNESSVSSNTVVSVSDIQDAGGLSSRVIKKCYKDKGSDTEYEIEYRLTERRP